MNELSRGSTRSKIKPEEIAFLLIVILGIIFRIWVSLPVWMHYDENYYLNIAQSYAIRGELTPYLWRLADSNILAGGGSGYGIITLTLWLNLVQNSLFWGRMLMVICGLLTAGVMYFVARLWWNSKSAGIAAFVFSIVSTSAFYTLIVKMDAPAILTYSLVLLLHILAVRAGRPILHFLVGVCAILTVEFHSLGILYVFALTCWYLFEQVNTMLTRKKLVINPGALAFAVGALLAGLAYLAVHVLPDPKAYFIISQECFECNEPIFTTEIKRFVRLLILRPQELLVLAVVIVALLRVKTKDSRHFILLILAWILAQAFFGSPPYVHYTNHIWPLLALGVGGWFVNAGYLKKIKWRVPLGYAAAFAFLFLNLGLHIAGQQPYLLAYPLKTDPAVSYIQEHIATDTVVMGNIPTYYPLREYSNYLAYRDGSVYGAKLRGETMLDFWRRVQPQVIILDEEKVEEDIELQRYIAEKQLINVMPELWAAPSLEK